MKWRFIDFHKLLDFDLSMVQQLEAYLEIKESSLIKALARSIANAFEIKAAEKYPTKLSEATEFFRVYLKEVQLPVSRKDLAFKQLIDSLNEAFWHFSFFLEGCFIELNERIKEMSILKWGLTLQVTVQTINDRLVKSTKAALLLFASLQETICGLEKNLQQSINRQLKQYFFKPRCLDQGIERNLNNMMQFLHINVQHFSENFNRFKELNEHIDSQIVRLKSLMQSTHLDRRDKESFVQVYRLLKMIVQNGNSKSEIGLRLSESLRNFISWDSGLNLFEKTLNDLSESLFALSLEWKAAVQLPKRNIESLKFRINNSIEQIATWIFTSSHYRLTMLRTDPNPYKRARWGFSEWVVAPEMPQSKKLLHLTYQGQVLEKNAAHLLKCIERSNHDELPNQLAIEEEIEKLLHEMAQPLLSASVMKSLADQFLQKLSALDEFGSSRMDVVEFVGDALTAAMREDWKYRVLFGFPLFHTLFHSHMGLIQHFDDPVHKARVLQFESVFDRIEEWVEKNDLQSHFNEIEADICELKAYLQALYGSVQRVEKEKPSNVFLGDLLKRFRQELMEYRYLYGKFYHLVAKECIDSRQFRSQFLFVDQYFESLENLIYSLWIHQ